MPRPRGERTPEYQAAGAGTTNSLIANLLSKASELTTEGGAGGGEARAEAPPRTTRAAPRMRGTALQVTAASLEAARAGEGAASCSSAAAGAPEDALGVAEGRSVLLIGVAGPSGAGKSALAGRLVQELGSPVGAVCLDWFISPEMDQGAQDWERPSVIDFASLRAQLSQLKAKLERASRAPTKQRFGVGKSTYDVVLKGRAGAPLAGGPVCVLAEGFLLFFDPQLCDLLDAHIWVEADMETCMARRRRRNKKRRANGDFDTWYRDEVWANFQRFREAQLANAPGALRLDSAAPLPDLVQQARVHLQDALPGGLGCLPVKVEEGAEEGLGQPSWQRDFMTRTAPRIAAMAKRMAR
ncbi:unnamed protein product, partial [Prorocentrum cordatum]